MKRYDFTKDPDGQSSEVTLGKKKSKKLDLVPRLICLVVALFIWSYMVSLNDTDVTDTVTLKVDVIGADALKKDHNMLIYGLDRDTITVNIKGSQRDLKRYTATDYRATIDVSELTDPGRHSVPVKIDTPAGSSITVSSAEIGGVNLFSDVIATKSVRFDVVRGDMITLSSYTYKIVKDVEYIEITGPGSMLDSISSARYTVQGEFYSSKTFSGFAPEFCDRNGDVISFEQGIIGYSTVSATVRVMVSTGKQIPIKVKIMGMGNDLIATPSVDYVNIYGDPTQLAQISEYTVTLSEAVLGRDSTVTITNEGFPEGVTVENDGISVTISFSVPH